jgi:hypothetical protein
MERQTRPDPGTCRPERTPVSAEEDKKTRAPEGPRLQSIESRRAGPYLPFIGRQWFHSTTTGAAMKMEE